MEHLHKCPECKNYTMKQVCPSCGKETVIPKPAKFSPEDRTGKYRIKAKIDELIKKGELSEDDLS